MATSLNPVFKRKTSLYQRSLRKNHGDDPESASAQLAEARRSFDSCSRNIGSPLVEEIEWAIAMRTIFLNASHALTKALGELIKQELGMGTQVENIVDIPSNAKYNPEHHNSEHKTSGSASEHRLEQSINDIRLVIKWAEIELGEEAKRHNRIGINQTVYNPCSQLNIAIEILYEKLISGSVQVYANFLQIYEVATYMLQQYPLESYLEYKNEIKQQISKGEQGKKNGDAHKIEAATDALKEIKVKIESLLISGSKKEIQASRNDIQRYMRKTQEVLTSFNNDRNKYKVKKHQSNAAEAYRTEGGHHRRRLGGHIDRLKSFGAGTNKEQATHKVIGK